jgi:hypothetical protein
METHNIAIVILGIGCMAMMYFLLKTRMDLEEAHMELWAGKQTLEDIKSKFDIAHSNFSIAVDKMTNSMPTKDDDSSTEITEEVEEAMQAKLKTGDPGDGSRWDEI